jgi:hypothetical protein
MQSVKLENYWLFCANQRAWLKAVTLQKKKNPGSLSLNTMMI